jgi:hypothetical protein
MKHQIWKVADLVRLFCGLLLLSCGLAWASTLTTADYNFLIASGFLCDANHSGDCPAIAQAANGESIEISGAGTLSLTGHSVSAAGTFTQKSPSGDIVSMGVWTATALESFQSYGLAPGVLRDYPQLRAFRAFTKSDLMARGLMIGGPLERVMGGPMVAGGLAVIRIRLLPDAGSPMEAVLRITCATGKVPEGEQNDGVRLTVSGGPAFDSHVSGKTVFLLRRPAAELAPKNSEAAEAQR